MRLACARDYLQACCLPFSLVVLVGHVVICPSQLVGTGDLDGSLCQCEFLVLESNQREKIKFVLNDAYSLAGSYRPMLLAALSGVDLALQSSIVTDKGHKSKSLQRTVIEFWAQQTCHQHGVDAQSVLTDLTGDKPSIPNLNTTAAAFITKPTDAESPATKRVRFVERKDGFADEDVGDTFAAEKDLLEDMLVAEKLKLLEELCSQPLASLREKLFPIWPPSGGPLDEDSLVDHMVGSLMDVVMKFVEDRPTLFHGRDMKPAIVILVKSIVADTVKQWELDDWNSV